MITLDLEIAIKKCMICIKKKKHTTLELWAAWGSPFLFQDLTWSTYWGYTHKHTHTERYIVLNHASVSVVLWPNWRDCLAYVWHRCMAEQCSWFFVGLNTCKSYMGFQQVPNSPCTVWEKKKKVICILFFIDHDQNKSNVTFLLRKL